MRKLLPILFCVLFVSCSSHLYDGAIKYDNYAYIKCDRSYVTKEALSETYFDYFKDSGLDYMIIQYNDDLDHGVYISKDTVLENVLLSSDDTGTFMLADDTDAVSYTPKDGKLE